MSILEVALAYCRAGLAVLPAHPTEKRPLAGRGQHGKSAPFPTEAQVRAQCASAQAICILCGGVSGHVECVDFDDAGSAFPAWREALEAARPGLLARLVIERSPSGGIHVVYRAGKPVPGSHHLAVAADGKLLIETRGEGALFLCDPSPNYQLQQGAFTALPRLTPDEREAVLSAARALNRGELRPTRKPVAPRPLASPIRLPSDFVATPYGAKVLDDEAAHVRSASKGFRNKTLNDAAFKIGQLVAGGQIPQDDARAVLLRAAYDAGLPEHEANATLSSGLSAGYQSPRIPEPRAPDGPAVDLSGIAAQAAHVAHGDPMLPAEPIDEPDDPEETDTPDDPGPTPESLARAPGFIGDVMDFTLDVMPTPNPVLAFAGALVLQAHLGGRKVRDPGNIRTNIYILALANPGSGKDWPRKINAQIMHNIGADRQIANRFSSGEGLQDSLIAEPAMLFQADEIAGLFTQINKAKDARFEAAKDELLTIYTSADSFYKIRRKAGTNKDDQPHTVNQPNVTILGTAPSEKLYQALSLEMVTDGLFARMIVLEAEKEILCKDAKIFDDIPPHILEAARWWQQYRPSGPDGKPGDVEMLCPRPTIVPLSPEAQEIMDAWRLETQNLRNAAGQDLIRATFWSRGNENARKFALIYAISANRLAPVIDRDAAEWAVKFTRHQIKRMLFMTYMHVAVNDVHAAKQSIIRMLRKAPKGEMTKSQLTRRTQGLRSKERDDILADLTLGRQIQILQVLTNGRPREMVRLPRD